MRKFLLIEVASIAVMAIFMEVAVNRVFQCLSTVRGRAAMGLSGLGLD